MKLHYNILFNIKPYKVIYSHMEENYHTSRKPMAYFNRVTGLEAVQLECGAHVLFDKLVPYVVFRKAFVHAQVHDPRGEALIEP